MLNRVEKFRSHSKFIRDGEQWNEHRYRRVGSDGGGVVQRQISPEEVQDRWGGVHFVLYAGGHVAVAVLYNIKIVSFSVGRLLYTYTHYIIYTIYNTAASIVLTVVNSISWAAAVDGQALRANGARTDGWTDAKTVTSSYQPVNAYMRRKERTGYGGRGVYVIYVAGRLILFNKLTARTSRITQVYDNRKGAGQAGIYSPWGGGGRSCVLYHSRETFTRAKRPSAGGNVVCTRAHII